jgi:hypothetical protein
MDIKYGLYDADGDAIAGSSDLKVKIKRDADDFFFDFDDTTFKADTFTTLAATMAEIDATNAAGEYEQAVDISGWNDGIYTIYINHSGSPKQNGSMELVVVDGVDSNLILQRLYQRTFYKMNVTDATGAAALRNVSDGADIATGSITDNDTTTVRAKWSWA